MKNKSDITFLIFAFNEEKRIEYPIKCFLPYGEVIIFLDEKSTDKTALIAKKLGAKVVRRPRMRQDFAETKEMADFVYQFVKTDWVFWGFADEIVPKPCLEFYKKISKESKYKIVVQKRKTLLFNSSSEYFPCYVTINLFRKDSIDFTNNTIHQMGKFSSHVKPSEVLYLPPIDEYSVYHFSIFTTEVQLGRLNNYYLVHAQSAAKKNKKISLFKIARKSILPFIKIYILGRAYRRGVEGFITAMHSMFYHFITLAKVYELKNNITPDSMEKKFVKMKKCLLTHSPKSNLWQKLIANLKIAVISRLHKYYKFRQKSP